MIITKVDYFTLKCSVPKKYPTPLASFVTDGAIFLRVFTDEGVIGIGEPSPYGAPMSEMQNILESVLIPAWIGSDPLNIDFLTRQHACSIGYGKVGQNALIAGFSQALWDIKGKVKGKPIYKLINPDSDGKVRAYASGGMWYSCDDPSPLVDEALCWQAEGYTAFKLRPETPKNAGNHFERNTIPPPVHVNRLIKILQQIRLATGENMDLLVDAGCRLSFDQSLSLCRAMEELNCTLLEEPMPRDPAQYARLRNMTKLPIAGGECLVSIDQYRNWVKADALDILQPDANLSGITEILSIDKLANDHNLSLIMHNWANDISIAANVHLAAALNSCSMVEYNLTFNPLRSQLATDPVIPIDGYFCLSDTPGLGTELDQSTINKFCF